MTVKTRITLFMVGAGVVSSLIFSIIIFLELLEQPIAILETVLLEEARQVTQMYALNRTEPHQIYPDSFSKKNTRYWIEIYDPSSSTRLFQSALAQSVTLPRMAPKSSATVKALTPDEGSKSIPPGAPRRLAYRVKTYPIEVNGELYITQIAKSMEKLVQEKHELLLGIASGLIFSILILIAISHFLSGRILRPISEMKALAQNINDKNLDERIPVGDDSDEFSELTRTINRMLDRLQYSFTDQRNFLFATSHELKTPLTTIRLAVDEICASQPETLPGLTENRLQQLTTHVLRMEKLVKDLLHLSSLETLLRIQPAPVRIFNLLTELAEEYQLMASSRNITMIINLHEGLVIQGDAEKLRRAFSNLLDNAIKYNVEGGRIELTGELSGSELTLTFLNTGAGLDESEISLIFNQFYRADKSRSSESGGSGLGLSIVKRIIELHGGRITFASAKKSWSCVTLSLPTEQ